MAMARRSSSPSRRGPGRLAPAAPRSPHTSEPAPVSAAWQLTRHSLPIAIVLMLIMALSFFRQTDPDFWWHWQAGRDMVATGQLPRVDTYSYTAAGEPWVAHEWLWEVLTAVIMASVGYLGISLLLAGLMVVTFALLYRLLRAQGLVEWAAAALVGLGAVMSMQTVTARPHALTYLFVITTLWLLEWWRRGQEGRLWWLAVLLVPWANVHGGYAIGLGLVGLVLVGELGDAWLSRRQPRLKTLVGVLLVGGITASLNPQGPAIHLFALGFLNRDSAMHKHIQEWASPNFHDVPGQAFALTLLLVAIVGLGGARLRWSSVLPALAVIWLGLQSVRHIPLFALAALPVLAAGLATWPRLAARVRPAEPAAFSIVNWLMVIGLWTATAVMIVGQPLAQIKREPNEDWYPRAGLAYLEREQPAGPIFNYDGWGGYLIARAPQYKVYLDGRTDLYGAARLEEYQRVIRLEPGWRSVLDDRGIHLVLVRREQALANALRSDPAWELLVDGHVEVLLRRR